MYARIPYDRNHNRPQIVKVKVIRTPLEDLLFVQFDSGIIGQLVIAYNGIMPFVEFLHTDINPFEADDIKQENDQIILPRRNDVRKYLPKFDSIFSLLHYIKNNMITKEQYDALNSSIARVGEDVKKVGAYLIDQKAKVASGESFDLQKAIDSLSGIASSLEGIVPEATLPTEESATATDEAGATSGTTSKGEGN